MGLKPRGGSSPLQRIGTPGRGFRVFGNTSDVILLWPLLLVGAVVIMGKARQYEQPQRLAGRIGSAAWALAGVLSVVIVAIDFTIAVLIFPFAAFATLWLAANAAGREAMAFPVGVLVAAAVLLLA